MVNIIFQQQLLKTFFLSFFLSLSFTQEDDAPADLLFICCGEDYLIVFMCPIQCVCCASVLLETRGDAMTARNEHNFQVLKLDVVTAKRSHTSLMNTQFGLCISL